MPVVVQQTAEYVLANVTADMDAQRITANLRWMVGGVDCGLIEVVAQGEDFLAILGAMPRAGTNRADDIALLVHEFAVSKGIVQGLSLIHI